MNGNLDDTRIRALLHEAHQSDDSPPFETVWSAAGAAKAYGATGATEMDAGRPIQDGRARAWWLPFSRPLLPRLALASGLAVSVLAVGLLIRFSPLTNVTPGTTAVDETAWTWSDWTGPTDFLLETPGSDLLGSGRLLDEQAYVSYETQTTQERTET